LRIHDEQIEFVTAVTDGTQTEQLTLGGNAYYWTDSTKTKMTTDVTDWPVIVYVYEEDLKAEIRFTEVIHNNQAVKVPMFRLGSGDENGHNYALLYKDPGGLRIRYEDTAGRKIGMDCVKEGYTDLYGLRKPTELNFSEWDSGSFVETLDGDKVNAFTIEFDENDRPIRFTDGAGHETAVVWE
jgi:hypothetical protein